MPVLDIPATRTHWQDALNGGLVGVAVAELAAGAAPPLFGSGARYDIRDEAESWRSPSVIAAKGGGDCEDLAAQRAAEMRLWGYRALLPGSPGAERAKALGLNTIDARVRLDEVAPAFFHVVTEYTVDGATFTEDPSLMLGMRGQVDPRVLALEGARPTAAGHRMNLDQFVAELAKDAPKPGHKPMQAIKVSGDYVGANPALLVPNLRLTPDAGYRVVVDKMEPGLYLVAVVEDTDEIEGTGAIVTTAALAAAATKALASRAVQAATDGEPGVWRTKIAPRFDALRDRISQREGGGVRDWLSEREGGGLRERLAEREGGGLLARVQALRQGRADGDVFVLPRRRTIAASGCRCGQ